MIKERFFAFIIDIILFEFSISMIVNNIPINPQLEDIIFLSAFSSYYIFSNIIFKKTLGKKVLRIESRSEREKGKDKQWFALDILYKYIIIFPIVIMFSGYDSRIGMILAGIYYVYFSVSEGLLQDKLTKIKVVKEEYC